jgi:hypothetical protein
MTGTGWQQQAPKPRDPAKLLGFFISSGFILFYCRALAGNEWHAQTIYQVIFLT